MEKGSSRHTSCKRGHKLRFALCMPPRTNRQLRPVRIGRPTGGRRSPLCAPSGAHRFPCASIRARQRARAVVGNQPLWLAGKGLGHPSNLGKPQCGASGRRQPSRGAGGRLRNAGQRSEPVLSTGGRGWTMCHCIPAARYHTTKESSHVRLLAMLISTVPKSCRTLVRDLSRTRGGLVCFSHNYDMRMHGWLWLEQTKPNPSGVEARSDSGVVLGRFLTAANSTRRRPVRREVTTGR